MPVADMFWGDRYGVLSDPFGHSWGLATHKEDLSAQEIEERAKAFWASMERQAKTA
jgi:PhnB protein